LKDIFVWNVIDVFQYKIKGDVLMGIFGGKSKIKFRTASVHKIFSEVKRVLGLRLEVLKPTERNEIRNCVKKGIRDIYGVYKITENFNDFDNENFFRYSKVCLDCDYNTLDRSNAIKLGYTIGLIFTITDIWFFHYKFASGFGRGTPISKDTNFQVNFKVVKVYLEMVRKISPFFKVNHIRNRLSKNALKHKNELNANQIHCINYVIDQLEKI